MLRATLTAQDTAPAQASLDFTAALNAGELEAATACFTRDACLVTPGATAIHGREEIRTLLAQMIARGSHIEVTHSTVLCAGEVAMARQRWIVSSRGVGDERYAQDLSPCLVMRRLEGEWKLAIAMPWG
jgi:ketosteroid isomerase-like protein